MRGLIHVIDACLPVLEHSAYPVKVQVSAELEYRRVRRPDIDHPYPAVRQRDTSPGTCELSEAELEIEDPLI